MTVKGTNFLKEDFVPLSFYCTFALDNTIDLSVYVVLLERLGINGFKRYSDMKHLHVKIMLFLIFLLFPLLSCAKKINLDPMYKGLDNAIAHINYYVSIRQKRIKKLNGRLQKAQSLSERLLIHRDLAYEYIPFINDSAIFHLNQCVNLALAMGHRNQAEEYRSLISLQCSKTGMYQEAFNVLDSVRTEYLTRKGRGIYYWAYYNVYNELSYYAQLATFRALYAQKAKYFQNLMFQYILPYSDPYYQIKELNLMNAHQLKRSMALNTAWLGQVKKGSHRYALVALYRYLEYKAQKDTLQMMYWLTQSALSDVRNGVMDQGSMWEIANQMMVQGEVDWSYRYISFASSCAAKFGSRQRNWQISPLLTSVANNYKLLIERRTYQLFWLIVMISILAVLLLLSLFFVNRQRKRLSLAQSNLRDINGQLSTLNLELTKTNTKLSVLNQKLTDSSKVKEEYIGRFQSMCSEYIEKMDKFRKHVNRGLRNRQIPELLEETRSIEWKEEELKELYSNFDTSFFRLFPNFIEEFNALLRPESRIILADPSRLNTPLRIFALIRLGIEDSSKIAEFLNYSVNTIYNYRARVKNGAISDRENFERHVKEIGLPKQIG